MCVCVGESHTHTHTYSHQREGKLTEELRRLKDQLASDAARSQVNKEADTAEIDRLLQLLREALLVMSMSSHQRIHMYICACVYAPMYINIYIYIFCKYIFLYGYVYTIIPMYV